MHPAFSVIFLTTLIGTGQGLFLALYTAHSYAVFGLLPMQDGRFFALGSVLALLLLTGGLVASFFHLGRPERAWRAAAQWRTSWLSREVIVLPVFMALVAAYGLSHEHGWSLTLYVFSSGIIVDVPLLLGTQAMLAAFALFTCTGMIYACLRFIREWYSPLTVINYTLLGAASGFTLAAAYAGLMAPELVYFYTGWAITLTLLALAFRGAALIRNARLKPKSTLQTAIGVKHPNIAQKSQGFMAGSFNTREFFHGRSVGFVRSVKWLFLLLAFAVPLALLSLSQDTALLAVAFTVQYLGLLAERWFFFAQANHPQNLYYQVVS